MIQFDAFIQKVIADADPCSQNTSEGNLGFGWIYYGMIRNVSPDFVVAIGSRRGFMPFCVARALQDNGHGKVLFVDPSYLGEGHPGWGGRGLWSDPADVEQRIESFDLGGWIQHLRMTSDDAFPTIRQIIGRNRLGVLIIDGAHTYEASLRDFDLYTTLMDEGLVTFHDATNPQCEVDQTLKCLKKRGYPILVIDRDARLALIKIEPH
jgi:hypothetical protein